MKLISSLLTVTSLLFIISCSSTDNATSTALTTSPATITSDNAQDLAIAATESAIQSTADNSNPFSLSKQDSSTPFNLLKLSEDIALRASDTIFDNVCTDSGNLDVVIEESGANSITFNNCSRSGVLLNGTMSMITTVVNNNVQIDFAYTDFTVTYNGMTETYSFNASCSIDDSTVVTCSALGADGRTYAYSTAEVTGNATSGYNITAQVTDPTHGIISIDASNVFFNCISDRPSTGSITFSASGESGSVTFNSCTSYTVEFNGNSMLYSWAL